MNQLHTAQALARKISVILACTLSLQAYAQLDSSLEQPIQLGGLGQFSFGMTLVRPQAGDPVRVITANGGDWEPQTMLMHILDSSNSTLFPGSEPIWSSEEMMNHFAVAAGDIDGDGIPDLLSAVYSGPMNDFSLGGIYRYTGKLDTSDSANPQLFYERKGILITKPFGASDIQLADIDADGDLDIVAAARKSENLFTQGYPRVYLNRDGEFSEQPDWRSGKAKGGGRIELADFDGDGFLDAAIQGDSNLDIFFGKQVAANTAPFTDANHFSIPIEGSVMGNFLGLASAPIGESGSTAAIMSTPTGVFAYAIASTSATIIWSDTSTKYPFGVAVIDLNDDGLSDLITTPWAEPMADNSECSRPELSPPGDPSYCVNAAISVRNGTAQSFEQEVSYRPTQERTIAQKVVPITLNTGCLAQDAMSVRENHPLSVVSFKSTGVEEIVKVTLDGVETTGFQFSPGRNWMTLFPPVQANQEIEIVYRKNGGPGLVVATGSPQQGVWLMENTLMCVEN